MSRERLGDCGRCGKRLAVNTPMLLETGELICHRCADDEDEFGRGVGQLKDKEGRLVLEDKWQKHDVVISKYDDGLSVWTKNGGRGWVLSEDERELWEKGKIEELLDLIHERVESGVTRCTSCGEDKEIVGRHFAGRYCKECWEEYKDKNSGRCGMCGAPMWRCVC